MNKWSFAVVTVAVLSTCAFSYTIDFEDLYTGVEMSYGMLEDGYGGFSWSSYAKWITSQKMPDTGYERGTIGHVSLYTSGCRDITLWSAVPVDFRGAYITSAYRTDQDVTVEGWRGGTMIYSDTIITSNDQAYWFGFDYYNIDTLVFRPNRTEDETDRHIVIDNITINADVCRYSLVGDMNHDCKVDLSDLALMAMNWLVDCDADPTNLACEPE